jgi:hypothetical protein
VAASRLRQSILSHLILSAHDTHAYATISFVVHLADLRRWHLLSTSLIDQLHQLKRADKLRVIQLLAIDLAVEENAVLVDQATYDVWSPLDSADAAVALRKMLNDAELPNE